MRSQLNTRIASLKHLMKFLDSAACHSAVHDVERTEGLDKKVPPPPISSSSYLLLPPISSSHLLLLPSPPISSSSVLPAYGRPRHAQY